MDAVHERCRLYYGWRDNCGGSCSTTPSGWGYTTHDDCVVGLGTTNRCGIHTSDDVRMFTVNTFDSEVDDNDRFYYGLHCTTGSSATLTTTGACPAGSYITSLNADGSFVCRSAEEAIAAYVRSDCRVYAGWIDNCNGCTTTASRSGYAGQGTCAITGGPNGTCANYALGGTTVRMFGLNTDGGVDGNDQFRIGFSCAAVSDASTSAAACASGQLATGVAAGSVTCNAAEARADDYVRAGCSVYQGWADNCGGSCSSAPTKWGRANSVSCQSVLGGDNSCGSYTLGGRSVPMFGLNTDGDVDENDRFYLGLRCL